MLEGIMIYQDYKHISKQIEEVVKTWIAKGKESDVLTEKIMDVLENSAPEELVEKIMDVLEKNIDFDEEE